MSRHVLPLLALAAFATTAAAQCTGEVAISIGGQHNPFLAGQPPGTWAKQDQAPNASPFLVPIAVSPGERLQFLSVSGDVNNVPSCCGPGPEGDAGNLAAPTAGQGISGFTMPINCLLGVFLDDGVNGGAAPASLDFSQPSQRDQPEYSPELFQTFFIGDGLQLDGVSIQEWIVPAGATRLFLGSADGFGWTNNSGSFTLTVKRSELLSTCEDSISLSLGGTQTLQLAAGSAHAGMPYLLLGTLSGTSPGLPTGGVVLPLNVDLYFTFTLSNANVPPLGSSFGVLDPSGLGTATVTIPGGSNPAWAGVVAHHAYVVIDTLTVPGAATAVLASNAVSLTLVP